MNAMLKKLTQLLDSSDLELRVAAIRVITEIGLSTKESIQALGRCLRESQDDLRLVALKALARLGAKDVAPMVVPLILSAGTLREHAMAVISAVGQTVIPQLKLLYSQADFHGKRSIITGLSRIGGKPALTFLLKILPLEPFEIQKHIALSVCEALERMPTAAQASVYSLILRLVREKEFVKSPQILVTGAILLGHLKGGTLARKARTELKGLMDKKYPGEVRRHALLSFNRLMSEIRPTTADVQFLRRALCDEDWHNMAQHALQGFQRLSVEPRELPKMVELLHKSPHFSVHIHVFERLQNSDKPEVAEAILPFLADPRFRVREAAEAALRKMPTSIESLFFLLMKTDDLEVTQRVNAILRDFPQETKQRYVGRAVERLLALFEDNDPHYRSFLEFVKNLDPEPLRKRVYQKAVALKSGKARDRWERVSALIQLLWDNHLITSEGRYLLAVSQILLNSKDLAPASRRGNLGLRVLRALIYDDYEGLAKRLTADKDLCAEDYYYLGFHFSEEGEELRPFAMIMLEHVVKKYPKSSVAGSALHKLQLQAKAIEAAQAEAQRAKEAEARKASSARRAKEAAAAEAARAAGLQPRDAARSGVPPAKGQGAPALRVGKPVRDLPSVAAAGRAPATPARSVPPKAVPVKSMPAGVSVGSTHAGSSHAVAQVKLTGPAVGSKEKAGHDARVKAGGDGKATGAVGGKPGAVDGRTRAVVGKTRAGARKVRPLSKEARPSDRKGLGASSRRGVAKKRGSSR